MAGDLTAQIVPYRMVDAEEHRYRLSRTMKAIIDEVTNLSLSAGVLSASNVGTAGVGPFKQKTGTDLEFKNINAGSSKITVTDDTGANEIDIDVDEVNIDHDSLLNFVANEHIDHTAVVLTAGVGLSGGGDISASRTFTVDLNELTTETSIAAGDFLAMVDITDSGSGKITFANVESTLNHDSLAGFVANEHIDHTSVDIIAGAGMTGGGDISSTRTLDVIAASNGGILVNADSVQLDINSLAVDTIASGDFLAFEDITGGLDNKITFANFEGTLNLANQAGTVDISAQTNLVAGTNITLVDDTLNVDDAFLLNTGDTGTGVYDFGGATSFEIPNSATPTVDADGEVAVDTTVTDFSHGIMKYFGGEELGVVAMPIAQFTSPTDTHIVTYNGTTDEFQLAAPSAGSAGLVFLSSVTASASSSMDFTSGIDSTFDVYMLILNNIVVSNNDVFLAIRVSEDGGFTFKVGGGDYKFSGEGRTTANTSLTEGDNADARLVITDRTTNFSIGNAATESYSGVVKIFNPSETSLNKLFQFESNYHTATSTNTAFFNGSGNYDGTTNAINAVQIIPEAGTITSGTARLYGITNS